MIRVVIVTNPYDMQGAVPQTQAIQEEIAQNVPEASVHVVDFNRVRANLPIATTPTVFLGFDQHTGQFDPALVTQAIRAVKQANSDEALG